MEPNMKSTYSTNDVIFLMRDVSDETFELSTEEKERRIQAGVHYSEMLALERPPKPHYFALYEQLLVQHAPQVALHTAIVAEKVIASAGAKSIVLASLARAGTPVGILLKRYIAYAYNLNVPHYTLSILRGRGIDERALSYIAEHHEAACIQFVDGWTGKGAIMKQLQQSIAKWNASNVQQFLPTLAVLADPARCATIAATTDDVLIPSACLNATISGLVSRTIWHDGAANGDFHGAKLYRHLAEFDVSTDYIEKIVSYFTPSLIEQARTPQPNLPQDWQGEQVVAAIQAKYSIANPNYIKPGIGETTRVLLRRVPWKILINAHYDKELLHIKELAAMQNVPLEVYNDMPYACCGLIKELT